MPLLPPRARLILLPGLATHPRVLAPQIEAFGDSLYVPLWLQPQRHESLPDYAERFAEMLRPALDDGRELFLGGVSFGGMVAYEMARILRPRAVLLVASCRTGDAIPAWMAAIERLSVLVPNPVLTVARPLAGRLLAGIERLQGPDRQVLLDIIARADPQLIRWSARACTHWRSSSRLPDDMPVFHLHGDRDWIIPRRRVDPADTIAGGRHLIHLSHAAEVNAWLRKRVEAVLEAGG